MEHTNGGNKQANGRINPVFRNIGRSPRSLRGVTTGELRNRGNSRLTELIVAKIHSLNTGNFVDRQLLPKVRTLLELLRDTLSGRYPHLSVAAFAEVLLAMDHFIEVNDDIPDPRHRGMEDDYRKVIAVTENHHREIKAYQGWRSLQGRNEALFG